MIDAPRITDRRGSKRSANVPRRLGDELEQDRQVAERQLAARVLAERHLPVVAVVDGAAALERVERVDLIAGAEPAIHLVEEAQVVLALFEREQRQLERQALDRDREGVLHRLADRHGRALANQALLDDLAAEQDADTQDPLPRSLRLLHLLRWTLRRRH
jgi:CheY-like chemotaxis protein